MEEWRKVMPATRIHGYALTDTVTSPVAVETGVQVSADVLRKWLARGYITTSGRTASGRNTW